MDQARWDRIAMLFLDAVERPTRLRAGFLDEACTNDAELRAEVAAMLKVHGDGAALAIERRLEAEGGTAGGGALPVGTRVGPYRVDALVGEGGMGEVYRAERVDGGYRQTVALKVLRPGYATAEAVRRFRVERQVLARLVHPGIAAIYDGGALADGRPYLVLQYVDGVPVTQYCDRHALGVGERVRLVCRVAAAVQAAHGRLVVHRDLKPSNVLVDASGAPWLLDFGIAKLLDARADGSLAVATRPDVRLLTPGHAAPEQLCGEPVGVAADVYGLGVLLFELLAGRRPFLTAGRTPAEFERAVLLEPPPAPSAVAPPDRARALRGDLDAIVLMALRKEPARRYATVAGLAEDLERYLAGRPVRARRDTLAYRTRRFVGRNHTAVAAGVAFALALAGFAATSAVQARRVARERDRAEQARAAAEAERAAAEDVVGVLTRLFERANPALVPGGDTARVAALLDEGERRVDSLAAHPERQARLWRVLGNMHVARGAYARGIPLLQRSWNVQQARRGPDDPDAARTYHELAVARSHYHGAPAVRPMLDTSLVRLRRVLGDTDRAVVAALQDRARAAASPDEERRLVAEAAAAQRRRQPAADAAPDSMTVAALLNNTATAHYGRGALAEARTAFEATLDILERHSPPGHPARLTTRRNLAAALSGLGEWTAAERLVREIIAHSTRMHPDSASPADLEELAVLAAHQGRLGEAEVGLRAALARFRAQLAPDHWRVDNTLRNLGLVVVTRGRVAEGLTILDSAVTRSLARDGGPASRTYGYMTGQRVRPLLRLGRPDEAGEALRESDRVLRPLLGPDDSYQADLGRWHGEYALARGDAAAAEPHFRDALRRLTARLPARHPSVAGAECLLGAALVGQGRIAEGRPHVTAACPAYARWGLADSLAVAWGRQALAAAQR